MKRETPLFIIDTKKSHKKGECDFLVCTDKDNAFVARIDYVNATAPDMGEDYRIDYCNNGISLKLSIIRMLGNNPNRTNLRTLMKRGLDYYAEACVIRFNPNSITTEQTEVACDSYTWTDGKTYIKSGTYYQYLQTIHGCDSLEILNLIIHYSDTAYFTAEGCDSYEWHGQKYTTSGRYEYLTKTIHGCDSLEVLHLTVKYSTYFTYDTTVCGSYQFAEEELTMSGTYVDTITNVVGCDSIITVNLIVHPITPTQYVYDTICSCDLPYIFNDSIYSATGTYIQYYQNQYGCDSNIVLSLAVVEKLAVVVDSLPNLCADDKSYEFLKKINFEKVVLKNYFFSCFYFVFELHF